MIKAGLIGEKLSHSLSPQIHEKYWRLCGISGAYRLLETLPDGLPALLDRLEAEGYAGVNVTIPYKKAVLPHLHTLSPEAQSIGAVNTIRFENGQRTGYNTDYFGLKSLLERHAIPLAGQRVAVLGGGGAARCAYRLAENSGAAQVFVVSRHPETADTDLTALGYDALERIDSVGVLINTTPVGMYPHPDECPVSDAVIQKCRAVADVIYNPLNTLLIQKASALGLPSAGGLWMLCAQALAAQQIWTGRPFTKDECAEVYASVRRSNIVLIGMPGSGKSTIGQLLAKQLGMAFADTDALVETAQGPILGIFSTQGEVMFRHYEQLAAEKSANMMRTVIATGGGIIHTEAAVKALRESGIIVYVDRPLTQLLKDTKTEGRPLLASGRDALTGLYEKRHSLYKAFADITVDNTADAQTCVSNILKNLEAYKNEDTRA